MSKIKKAQTQNPVLEIIRDRWSARSFSNKPISAETMNTIVEAASWAFSAMNEQPWRYAVAYKGTPLFEKFHNLLMPGNRPWCANAAALVLSLGKTKHYLNGHDNPSMMHDVGAANMLFTLQANALGIYTHVLGGYDSAKALEDFKLGDDLVPVYMIALGYLDDADKLEEPFKTRELTERTRKKTSELLVDLK